MNNETIKELKLKNAYYTSLLMLKEFEGIIRNLKIRANHIYLDKEQIDFLNDIKLAFSFDDNSNAAGYANLSTNTIYINLYYIHSSISYALVHELAHLIHYKYFNNGKHTIEFAIVNAAICKNIFYSNINVDILDIFNTYDISEDIVYDKIKINIANFNAILSNIKFTCLLDLTRQAADLAYKIRKFTY